MHNNDESSVDIVGETFEKHLQGVDAPGERPNANRREPLPGGGLALAPPSSSKGRTPSSFSFIYGPGRSGEGNNSVDHAPSRLIETRWSFVTFDVRPPPTSIMNLEDGIQGMVNAPG
jgi:hypothetical protein